MIHESDLRLGNYLQDSKGRICMVEQLSIDPDDTKIYAVDSSVTTKPIKYIPLTKEWLERAGFEEIQEGYFTSYRIFYTNNLKTVRSFIKVRIEEFEDHNLIIWIGGDSVVHLYYLHQLQNLYYSLTKQELKIKR